MKCEHIQGTECAKWKDGFIIVDQCPSDLICNFLDLIGVLGEAYATNTTDWSLKCQHNYDIEYTLTVDQIDDEMERVCQDPLPQGLPYSLAEFPRECLLDSDCGTSDGGNTICTCGFYGTRYCSYAPGDAVRMNYIKAACAKNEDAFLFYRLANIFNVYLIDMED